MMNQVEFLEIQLSLEKNVMEVMMAKKNGQAFQLLDIRNAPAAAKGDQIQDSKVLAVKDFGTGLSKLDKDATYVVYDWNAGSNLADHALLGLLKAGFKAYKLAGGIEAWKGMQLPTEPAK